jgi:hypothetical protein
MEKMLWHRRESRRITEKTNIFLQPLEASAYSKSWENEKKILVIGKQRKKMRFQVSDNSGWGA